MNAVLLFIIGLVIITVGAELLLEGASKIASLLGVRPIVIGLTVVSISTSLPELAVGLTAVRDGAADMAIGNIAGTNLVNILFIFGLSAAIKPLPIQIKAIRFEVFVMIFTAILLWALCIDGNLSYWDGLIMLTLGIVYLVLIVKRSKKETREVQKEFRSEYRLSSRRERRSFFIWSKSVVFLIVGIAGTIWGADLLVDGAISIAKALGMSDAVIGLTIIAIGTSAPELITTIVATFKGDRDVAIGNLIGSCISNILIILSTTTLFVPEGLHVNKEILWIDLPLMALVAMVCYPIFKSGQKISRMEGIFFVAAYIIYIAFLLYFRT